LEANVIYVANKDGTGQKFVSRNPKAKKSNCFRSTSQNANPRCVPRSCV